MWLAVNPWTGDAGAEFEDVPPTHERHVLGQEKRGSLHEEVRSLQQEVCVHLFLSANMALGHFR